VAALPEPVPGLVIGYAYLWSEEARQGREEARKDRPCVIVLSVRTVSEQTVVTVAPITHSPPSNTDVAVELPLATKVRLGLDDQPSWIIVDDLNRFVWPGVDLRRTKRDSQSYAFGLLPASVFQEVRRRVVSLARTGRVTVTPRTE
jgi:hypothetical protein